MILYCDFVCDGVSFTSGFQFLSFLVFGFSGFKFLGFQVFGFQFFSDGMGHQVFRTVRNAKLDNNFIETIPREAFNKKKE